jgi:superfamily II DNA helicase RecQ
VETKVCKKCGEEKSLSEYYVRKDRNNAPHAQCIKCFKQMYEDRVTRFPKEKQDRITKHRERKQHLNQGKKRCNNCQEFKSIEDYMTQNDQLKYAHCSSCRPLLEKQYFEKNPDKHPDRHITRTLNKNMVSEHIQSFKEMGCADCTRYYPDAMEFDHTCDPALKVTGISSIHQVGTESVVLELLKTELKKGEYVCVNCHRKRTAKRANNARMKYLSNFQDSSLNNLVQYVYGILINESCIDCNENNFLVLEFDHVRGSKTANISMMIKKPKTFSLDMVKKEIAKCEIRCANCHRIRTRARQQGIETTLQSPKNNSLLICQCGSRKTMDALYCGECYLRKANAQSKARYGDLDTLLSRLKASNFTQIGKELGVSANAVKKYIQRRGIDPKTLLPMKTDDDSKGYAS